MRELAGMARMSPSALSRIENGHVKPEYGTLEKIAGALNLEVSDIIGAQPDRVVWMEVPENAPPEFQEFLREALRSTPLLPVDRLLLEHELRSSTAPTTVGEWHMKLADLRRTPRYNLMQLILDSDAFPESIWPMALMMVQTLRDVSTGAIEIGKGGAFDKATVFRT